MFHLGGGGGAGKANFQDISITKYAQPFPQDGFDAASAAGGTKGFIQTEGGSKDAFVYPFGDVHNDFIQLQGSSSGSSTSPEPIGASLAGPNAPPPIFGGAQPRAAHAIGYAIATDAEEALDTEEDDNWTYDPEGSTTPSMFDFDATRKGIGFILPEGGSSIDVFVHVSALEPAVLGGEGRDVIEFNLGGGAYSASGSLQAIQDFEVYRGSQSGGSPPPAIRSQCRVGLGIEPAHKRHRNFQRRVGCVGRAECAPANLQWRAASCRVSNRQW